MIIRANRDDRCEGINGEGCGRVATHRDNWLCTECFEAYHNPDEEMLPSRFRPWNLVWYFIILFTVLALVNC